MYHDIAKSRQKRFLEINEFHRIQKESQKKFFFDSFWIYRISDVNENVEIHWKNSKKGSSWALRKWKINNFLIILYFFRLTIDSSKKLKKECFWHFFRSSGIVTPPQIADLGGGYYSGTFKKVSFLTFFFISKQNRTSK